jgi:hypothetical protein
MFFLKSHFFSGFVSGNFLRARFHSFGRVSRSRELLACTFTPFGAGFAFARTSRVHVFTLLAGFRVRENFLRASFPPLGRISRSREHLACTLTPFWAGFAFARTSRVHVFTLLDGFRVRENFLRASFPPFGRVLRSRELLTCTFTPFWTSFAFARTSCVYVFPLFGEYRVLENFFRACLLSF